MGGLSPDQRLSNIYKLYRAMRPGPDSPIDPRTQFAFYDPGLGAGEGGMISLRRLRNVMASAIGSGIDENVIDCYEAIIANWEVGDRILLFGFSRGAYTVRCVANVMNLCGVPTRMPDGVPVPKSGPGLRKIAEDAVKFVYSHGAGKDRRAYEPEREEKARRFRAKYASEGFGADGEPQGQEQPHFIGVFDTVAALGLRIGQTILLAGLFILLCLAGYSVFAGFSLLADIFIWSVFGATGIWALHRTHDQLKYFRDDPDGPITSWHFATWRSKHYDRFLDNKVRFARHALSIDENRTAFPRVGWGSAADMRRNATLQPAWLKQVWFAGNHSDVGGSYPESESRLSDIALDWMVSELREAVPDVQIRDDILRLWPDPSGLQHDQIAALRNLWPSWVPGWLRRHLTWSKTIRPIHEDAELHPTVYERIDAGPVPHVQSVKSYRPDNLRDHAKAGRKMGDENIPSASGPAR